MAGTVLPEGCEAKIEFYLSSDKAEAEIVVGLGGLTAFPDLTGHDPEPLKLVQSVAASVSADLLTIADDWRFMTRAEIANYKTRQKADASSGIEDEREF